MTVRWPYVAGMFCHLLEPAIYQHALKHMETRPKPTKIRGTVAIHVAAALTRTEKALTEKYFPNIQQQRRVIIGLVDIVDCLSEAQLVTMPKPPMAEIDLGHYRDGYFGYVLENPRLLAVPVRAKGQLGFWNWEPMESEASDAAK